MTDPKQRVEALYDALATRILLLDGAMGTMLHRQKLTAEDGPALDGCMEYLVKSRPGGGRGSASRVSRSRLRHH